MDIREHRVSAGTVAKATLVVLALWALANLVWLGREILFAAIFAALLGVFLSFFAEQLTRVKVPRPLAAVLVMAAFLGTLALLGWLLWPPVQEQLSTLRQQLPQSATRVGTWLEDVYRSIAGEVGGAVPPMGRLQQRFAEELARAVGGALPLLNTVMGAVLGLLVVSIAGLFMAVEPRLYRNGLVKLLPPGVRPRGKETLDRLAHTMRWWMVGTVTAMVLIAVLTTVGLWLMDMPAFLALGVLAGLLQFIPMFGPLLSAVPAILVALIISPTKVVWVILLYSGIQLVESNFITPLVMKGTVHLPPALTILFQSLMAVIFGFLGLAAATPVLAGTLVLVESLYVRHLDGEDENASARTGGG